MKIIFIFYTIFLRAKKSQNGYQSIYDRVKDGEIDFYTFLSLLEEQKKEQKRQIDLDSY